GGARLPRPEACARRTRDTAGAARMKTRRVLILLPALLFAGLAVLLWMRLYDGDPSRLPSALIGHEAPDFDLPAMAGLTTSSGTPVPGLSRADLGHGRVTVVNVWA